MSMNTEIEDSLRPLFEEAARTGKWFHCAYQDLWFSARQLREHQANGRFRWGAVNWTLRSPYKMLDEALRAAHAARANVDRVKALIDGESAKTAQHDPVVDSGRHIGADHDL